MSRLRDAPIWAKLGLIMIVPTIATVVVGTAGLIGHIETQTTAERARNLAALSEAAGRLVHDLQHERAMAAMLMSTRDAAAKTRNQQAYQAAGEAVGAATTPYAQRRNAVSGVPANVRGLLDQIDAEVGALASLRTKVTAGALPLSSAEQDYEELLSYLIAIRDTGAHLAGDNELNDQMRAAAEVSRIKDFVSQRRVVVHQILGQGVLTPRLQLEFLSTQTGEEQAAATYKTIASRAEKDLFDRTVSGSGLRKAERYRGYLNSQRADSRLPDRDFTSDEWDAAMREQGELLRTVETELDANAFVAATAIRDDVRQRVLLETGLLLGMLLLAVLFAWLVARSMARSLRELKHGALAIAESGLPQAVARLRDPSVSAHLSPAQAALQIAEPLPVRSRDEFGQVTEAFNAVHLEAVKTAAEQAALRASVATMFVNLARRSQTLVDRLIGQLDRLERSEEDPDRLSELFQLDHLATRMRRNDENLLVLAGADSTRVQREAAPLTDVLRAAQSEVEHYTRIDIADVDTEARVAAHAVNDVVHLVAELFDNATAFSPPDSQVGVEAHNRGEDVVVLVTDKGIGISSEQLTDLNRRLAAPPQVDVAVSRMMGLVVVARLANRHGVRVQLRKGEQRGTVAEVLVPAALLKGGGEHRIPASSAAAAASRGRAEAAARRADGPTVPAQSAGPAQPGGPAAPAASPRSPAEVAQPPSRVPAWADLTGAAPPATRPPALQPAAALNGGALPQRTVPSGGGPLIPRQAGSPEAPGAGAPPPMVTPPRLSAPPAPAAEPGPRPAPRRPDHTGPSTTDDARRNGHNGHSPEREEERPPVWPPLPASATAAGTVPGGPPATTAAGRGAVLEHTSELPRLTAPAGVPALPVAEETVELPIFRELESVWFRTHPDGPDGALALPASTEDAGPLPDPYPQEQPAEVPEPESAPAAGWEESSPAPPRPEQPVWRTAADDGWRAAEAVNEPPAAETTDAGLPRRTPMAQLVPGGIEADSAAAQQQRRTPEGVRGLLSAYHRGVQRGRTKPTDELTTPSPPNAGPQSGKSGKERDV
ncbi:hypothetical protein GCM10010124_24550 [Pilimelia terevasa]|uniref:histidine kinase n=2 Tax=Pilimelia terevasa TaxID=53372 RepID=A0A8J3BQF7_9ACTN|nr:hypothetical protein GCM10010124_24550 [Pilimelia terevasa]